MKPISLKLTLWFIFLVTFAPIAHAGDRVIRSEAAFKTNSNGSVQEASFAIGIGENQAKAEAMVTDTGTEAFAIGTAGKINLDEDGNVESVIPKVGKPTPQNGQGVQQIDINAIKGTVNKN